MSASQIVQEGAKFYQEVIEYDDEVEEEDNEGKEEKFDLSSAESLDASKHKSLEKPDTTVAEEDWNFSFDREKQISVDPVSLNQKVEGGFSAIPSALTGVMMHAPILPPSARPKFLSSSLPCSATSSPRSNSASMKSVKKWRNPTQKPHPSLHSLARQHSATLSSFARQHQVHLRRSKSLGEGRSCPPSDEFDIWLRNPSIHQQENGVQVLYECTDDFEDPKELDPDGDDHRFKCGALCLFLPGFSKGKQVKANKDEQEDVGSAVSRVVSLEKFECGSWSSSAIFDGDEEGEGMHSYFDLPLELIRNNTNDAHSPVKTAFVFERDRKGVLKKNTSRLAPRKSHESSNRHVRFSTSPPASYPSSPSSSCITPRLRKAREEFNAFLEAQSA